MFDGNVEEDDDKPISDTLEESQRCPFLISPANGILPPAKPTAFVAKFSPDQVSEV